MRKFVALATFAMFVAVSLAVCAQETKKETRKDRPDRESKERGQKITLNIEGVECGGCAKVLTSALTECKLQLAGKLEPNKDGPSQITATCEGECDLAACAAKIADAKTPHREQAKPGMCLVVFSKLDDTSAKEAVTACRKIEGVDGTACKADAAKGEIHIKLSGKQKVTPEQIVQALKDAGVQAQLARAKDSAATR